eukprot:TRINITY_DN1927_c0_g1_i1.p2 TRINITY_DN1927_c0_g1~~TRINITY_DN1927_c0_g1_i1.p2  ORF type:complete len:277 (+),score=55.35 TRINITY_DN1927_c0_g1_i1:25-831(+)
MDIPQRHPEPVFPLSGAFGSPDSDDNVILSSSAPSSRFISSLTPTSRKKAKAKNSTNPFLIGVCGGTASGKTTVCEAILNQLRNQRVAIISLDSFYKSLTKEQIELAHASNFNFDSPDAFDWELLREVLVLLSRGKTARIPSYDFTTHSRLSEEHSTTIHGSLSDIIFIEGIMIFHDKHVRDLFDMRIFVDTDSDTRLSRRVLRDMESRGRSLASILDQYEKFVKPAFDKFIWPTKKFAHMIIPHGASNTVAIEVIVQHVNHQLQRRT